MEQQGSCLCGQVRYRLDATFSHFYLCHCQHCQKGSGSAHGANLFAMGGQVHWLQGEELVHRFTLPGSRHGRAFCSHCGSPLPFQDGALLLVPAGSLDQAPTIAPTAHLFLASRAPWEHNLTALPGFDQLPPGA